MENKRIAIYLGHPAHFHLFKNVIRTLRQKHEVNILIKKKDVLENLLQKYGFLYNNILKKGRKDTKLGILWGLVKRSLRLFVYCVNHRPNLLIGTSVENSLIGFILGIPVVNVNEDDAAVVPLYAKLSYPGATIILAPYVCNCGKWEYKTIKYHSYHELAYLHPNHFTPDFSIVQRYLATDKPYYIIRFAKLSAHHDSGMKGIDNEIANQIIQILKPHGNIYITSERALGPQFEPYRMQIDPMDMHHVMAFADIYIGDSQTMAAEAGVLGVPFIRYNDFVGRIGYLRDLEDNYNLGFGIKSGQDEVLMQTLKNLLHMSNRKEVFQERRKKMLDDKIDYAKFLTWFIENFPDSKHIMQDESGRYVLVFNGEIYNYIEIRKELADLGIICHTKTDSEVLLKAYMQWGEACLDKFNGMFAFVIYDKQEDVLFGARDRFGIKPFYYVQTDTCFIFASEIPALLKNDTIKAEVNNQVMFDFLVFNRTDQTEATFFKGIHKLQHGHCFTINGNQLQIKQWYNLREKVKQAKPFISAEEYREYLSSSVGLRLRSDVPVGVCLSGGLDSSSITSLILKDYHKEDVNTFSAVYQPGETGDESHFIHAYRKEVRNMHFIQPTADSLLKDIRDFVQIHAEPIPSTSPYAQYKVMQLAKGKVVVTLDGQGADEQLAGYHYFYGFFFKDLFTSMAWLKLTKEMLAYYKQHKSWMGIQSFVYFMLPASLRTRLRSNEYGYLKTSFVQANASNNTIAGNLYGSKTLNEALLDHFEYKLEHLLKWGDRNSMASSIESRVPFLDYRLVEKTLATPNTRKIEKGITKSILREAMKDYLPEMIRQRKDKVGFETPQETWFRLPGFQALINDIISSESFRNRGYFDMDKVKSLYQQHLEGKINISKEIWKWIHTELWCREFIDASA